MYVCIYIYTYIYVSLSLSLFPSLSLSLPKAFVGEAGLVDRSLGPAPEPSLHLPKRKSCLVMLRAAQQQFQHGGSFSGDGSCVNGLRIYPLGFPQNLGLVKANEESSVSIEGG